ncbi:hypothetical protein ACT7CZ_17365 [Bacillus cereus]
MEQNVLTMYDYFFNRSSYLNTLKGIDIEGNVCLLIVPAPYYMPLRKKICTREMEALTF